MKMGGFGPEAMEKAFDKLLDKIEECVKENMENNCDTNDSETTVFNENSLERIEKLRKR